jgi:Flp pilus assembly pilin Flp
MVELIKRFNKDTRAQAMTEYAILISFCALSMFALIGPRGEALIDAIMFMTDQTMFVIGLPMP